MTEVDVFKILLQNEKTSDYNFDFPKQQSKTLKIIARNLTELIYESYKRKSCASTSKRYQILKFINNECEVSEPHVYGDYIKCVTQQIKCTFPNPENEDLTTLVREIDLDLKEFDINQFQENVSQYYRRKNLTDKEKQNRYEFINEKNQLKLNKKFGLEARKKYTFQANENLIQMIIGNDNATTIDIKITKNEKALMNNKDNQIKLAYTMINMGETDVLNKILQRISNSKVLSMTERNFLQYIWLTQSDSILNIGENIHIFYFLLEQIIFKQATNLLSLEDEYEVCQYFVNLENDCDIIRIRKLCKDNYNCYLKLKSLLFELYCISNCNDNVMKLAEVII